MVVSLCNIALGNTKGLLFVDVMSEKKHLIYRLGMLMEPSQHVLKNTPLVELTLYIKKFKIHPETHGNSFLSCSNLATTMQVTQSNFISYFQLHSLK